jgi:anti-sigma regulatory factor (Ser/Thr protein kinase)
MGQGHQQQTAAAAVVSDADDALLPSVLTAQAGTASNVQPWHGEFAAEPDQVASARGFVRRALAGCATADDAALLTSELFTNSVMHSHSGRHLAAERQGSVHILVCHRCPGLARITVIDDGSSSAPTVRRAGSLCTSGRGLFLVQELSARWGHDGGEHGRAVWFELDCCRQQSDAEVVPSGQVQANSDPEDAHQ